MKSILSCIATVAIFSQASHATVLVDDVWADGSRSNPPFSVSNSIWYASTSSAGTNLITATNSMNFLMFGANARMIMTYFTPTNTAQALAVGDTLKTTLVFTPTGVAPTNGSQGFRIALVNYGGTNRVGADGFSTSGANGSGVTGYMLNVNFGMNFGITRPIDTRQRTNITSTDLLGSLAVYERLTNGPVVVVGDPGFSNGVPYTLVFTAYRSNATDLVLTASFTGANLAITNTAVDTLDATVSFDALAVRLDDITHTATNFSFSQYKVELTSGTTQVLPGFTGIVRTGNDAGLSYTGAVGQAYRLWSSTNVTLSPVTNTWTSLTNGSFAGGTNLFNDLGGATSPQRFYIISSP